MSEGNTNAGPSGPIVYALRVPITVAGEEVRELRIRRPKARSFRKMRARMGADGARELDVGTMMEVLADCAGVSSLVVDELDAEDFFAAVEVLEGFLQAGPATPRR